MADHDEEENGEETAEGTSLPCFPKKHKKPEPEADEPKPPAVNLSEIYLMRRSEWPLIVVGAICAAGCGVVMPVFTIFFGNMFDLFFRTPEEIREQVFLICLIFLALGCLMFSLQYLQNSCWSVAAERYAVHLRVELFKAIVRQEVAYFDKSSTGVLSSKLSNDIAVVQAGLGAKVGTFISSVVQCLAGVTIAFVYGWKLTLILMSLSPALVIAGAIQASFLASGTRRQQSKFGSANKIAEETLSGIRTVMSFVLERTMEQRFRHQLDLLIKASMHTSAAAAFSVGFLFLVMFSTYGLGFWYVGILVANNEYTPGQALTVFFGFIIGAFGLGQAGQASPDFDKARGAASLVFQVLRRVPEMNLNPGGPRPNPFQGAVRFEEVHFSYPTRPEAPIFAGLTLACPAGSSTAIVGPSGSGKSTVIQLVQRFFDPAQGRVLVDGVDMKTADTEYMHSQIGIVSQEPVLFSCSIKENILYGKPDATDEEVIAAAKTANAHNFITQFPNGYDTKVGERGAQLSGGQKQRVAIARAVLKAPRLLLLDEATSALDAESEALVQEALDRLMVGRTSIVVAHRLSTIRKCGSIVVLVGGRVVEQGTHDRLMSKLGGVYAGLMSHHVDDKR
jgi:ATP-binding cassette subfamily B (MDR/TAP) protein 1